VVLAGPANGPNGSGAAAQKVSLDEGLLVSDPGQDLVALDDALQALAEVFLFRSYSGDECLGSGA
jgi:hypothetical protein